MLREHDALQRPTTTMPLQSLSLMNSEFALSRAHEPADEAASHAWSDFCQMLLAANGFLFVD